MSTKNDKKPVGKKYIVPFSWVMAGWVDVTAEGPEEAADLVTGIDLDILDEYAEYSSRSFEIDFELIEEVPGGPCYPNNENRNTGLNTEEG